MTSEITNRDDVIDSRDVIARIEELREELETAMADQGGGCETFAEWREAVLDTGVNEPYFEECTELAALEAMADEASRYTEDWESGATLIRDSHFEDYAQEFAEDIGAISDNARWPCTCINWKQAARELQMDYTSVDFDGVTYWVR